MGLKQSIVVRSRFSVPQGNGHGSRGGTPGKFVLRYMARGGATENIAPTKLRDADSPLQRYAAREQAAKESDTIPVLKQKIKATQRFGGLAFGDGDPALSDQKIREMSRSIQDHFDRGHTAIETIVSFTDAYLRENGILDPMFEHKNRGDYASHIDQLKLRMALMAGLKKLSYEYDDLHYVGAIQVDTNHVHCHLLLMDFGYGRRAADGTQKGKLTSNGIRNFRRGVDAYLDEKQSLKMLSSSVMHDKQNALCYVKRFAHQTMARNGVPQFLLSCLPENRNYWAANSNRQEMRKANAIVREFVVELLHPYGQAPVPAYQTAHQRIVAYADGRQSREGLSEDDRMKLIRRGEEQLILDCMNGVYSVLKRVPKDQMVIRTPMLDAMSMDYEAMAAVAIDDPMMEFGFKLRSYSTRLSHHRKLYHKFRDECDAYRDAQEKAEAARALAEHLALERDYQQMLMVKYQYFLSFLPPDESMEDEYEDVMALQDRVITMYDMQQDPSFQRMGQINGDTYGRMTYHVSGGSQIRYFPKVWERRVQTAEDQFAAAMRKFQDHLRDYGFDFDGHGVTRQKIYAFDDVKALDLHHMGYDFPTNVPVSRVNADRFIDMADRRYASFLRAKDYLERTGQEAAVVDLLPADVKAMKLLADRMRQGGAQLSSGRPQAGRHKQHATISLDRDYLSDMQAVVRSTVESARIFENDL